MKAILITGGGGFIGFNLCKRLLDEGNNVIAIDNLITSAKNNIYKLNKYHGFTFIKHNIVNEFSKNIFLKLKKVDTIYHLACPTGVPNVVTLAEEMLLSCSYGTRNVLEFAKNNNAKVIFSSSSEVYGDPFVFPQSEKYNGNVDSIGIRSPYEEGKRFSESLIQMYIRKYGLDAIIVRIFNTYGPGMSAYDTRVIPKFLNQAKKGDALTIEGKGLQTRTFCYVDDLISGLITIVGKGESGEVYNLGSDSEVSIIDLAKLLIKLTSSKSNIKFIERPIHDHMRRLPSLEKVKKLGWRPRYNLERGLLKTIDWYSNDMVKESKAQISSGDVANF